MRQIKVFKLEFVTCFTIFTMAYLGIYGITTIGQITDGKHMYRALEAHFSLYLALYKLYMSKFVDNNQEIEKELREAVMNTISLMFLTTPKKRMILSSKNIPVFWKL